MMQKLLCWLGFHPTACIYRASYTARLAYCFLCHRRFYRVWVFDEF